MKLAANEKHLLQLVAKDINNNFSSQQHSTSVSHHAIDFSSHD